MERTCKNGHRYFKTTDCPVCPICERDKAKADPWFFFLAGPARRALSHAGIANLEQLTRFTEAEILSLHGMGPNAIQKIKLKMESEKLTFKK